VISSVEELVKAMEQVDREEIDALYARIAREQGWPNVLCAFALGSDLFGRLFDLGCTVEFIGFAFDRECLLFDLHGDASDEEVERVLQGDNSGGMVDLLSVQGSFGTGTDRWLLCYPDAS